jgi:hypothetical protein
MKTLLLAATILIGVPAIWQEAKQPTFAKCQADQAVWLVKLNEGAVSGGWANSSRDASSKALLNWGEEMDSCEAVDPKNQDNFGGD